MPLKRAAYTEIQEQPVCRSIALLQHGQLIHGDDIDNRLKTLFDVLTMPGHQNVFPENIN